MVETGVTAGVGTGLTQAAKMSQIAFKVGLAAVTTQLAEMAAGLRDKFDARAIALQVSASLVNSQISQGISKYLGQDTHASLAGTNVASTVTHSILGRGITGTPVNIQSIAANAIGSTMGSEMGGSLAKTMSKANSMSQAKEFSSKQILPKKDYSSHEIEEAIVDGQLPLSEAKLDVSIEGVNNSLNEMRQARLQRWQQESVNRKRWNDQYYQASSRNDAVAELMSKAQSASTTTPYSFFDNATTIEKATMLGGAIALAPGALVAAAGYMGSALTMGGPIAEVGILAGPIGDAALLSAVSGVGGGLAIGGRKLFDTFGIFGRGGESPYLISNINRVSSNIANKPFLNEKALAEGWQPPYPADLSLREITIAKETKFYRVHTDINRPVGRFLAREKEIAPYLNNPEALRMHLGLPDVPIYITEVNIPSGTSLLAGRIGPQPSFGLMNKSGFQYHIVNIAEVPKSSFTNTRPILERKLDLRY